MTRLLKSMLYAGVAMFVATSANAETLTYNSFLPSGEPVNSEGIVPFWEGIERDTNGAYSGRMFYAGQMFGPAEVLSAVRDGAVDSGHVQATATISELPYAAAMSEMQVYGVDPVVATAAIAETYLLDCPKCKEELKNAGIVSLTGIATQPLYMVCSKDIKSGEDLKGLRLMTVLRSEQSVAKHFGMTPVSLSFNEMLPSLQRGAIDCIFTMDGWFPAFQLQDMVKTIIADESFGTAPIPNFLTLNRDVWDAMDADTQAIFIDNAVKMSAHLALFLKGAAKQSRAYAIENGVTEADLGPGFEATFKAFVDDEQGDIERSFAQFGIDDLGPMIAAYRENLAKWSEKIPEDVDGETLVEMMKSEIYAHVEY